MSTHIFDKIRLYLTEFVISLWALIVGVSFFTPNMQYRSDNTVFYDIALGIGFIITSIVTLLGIFWQGKHVDIEWLLIRIGLITLSFYWLSYGLVTDWTGYAVSLICFSLFIKLILKEREVRQNVDFE